ncbi:MAG: hypothetical protein JSR36_09555 [Proteobacteria bacterium]|nr:hypothetical protein [Pseudomonadota bacterium]
MRGQATEGSGPRRTGRRRAWVALAGAVVWVATAQADAPVGGQALGQLDAIVAYCTGLDPALAAAGEQRIAALTEKASTQQLADARGSEAYRAAYDALTEGLAALSREQSLRQCKALSQEQ